MKPEGPLSFTSLWINLSVPFIHESFIFWFNLKDFLHEYSAANDDL